MELIKDDSGKYKVTFKTQQGTTGEVDLEVSDKFEAQRLVAEMRVKDFETVSGIVDLTHQVVTQIIAGKKLSVLDVIELWRSHTEASKILSPVTSHVSYSMLLRWAREQKVGDLPITSITPPLISSYVNAGGERRSTAVRKLTALRQLFSFCLDNGYCVRNPAGESLVRVTYDAFTHNEKEATERTPFTDEEIKRLLEKANAFWRAAITVGYYTGLRLGDIVRLEWSSFTADGRLVVWTEKADARINTEVNDEIRAALAAYSELRHTTTEPQPIRSSPHGRHEAGSDDATNFRRVYPAGICEFEPDASKYVFPAERVILMDPRKRSSLSMQFQRLCERAGIKGKSFHCLRHTMASNRVAAGSSILDVAAELGHKSPTTTEIYVHKLAAG